MEGASLLEFFQWLGFFLVTVGAIALLFILPAFLWINFMFNKFEGSDKGLLLCLLGGVVYTGILWAALYTIL